MSQRQDNLIVVLDVGSAWTRMLAADLNEGALRYRGHGMVESAGMRKGLIADLAPAMRAVKAASEQAERLARTDISTCAVGVGGPHIRGLNTNGGITLGGRLREILRDDVKAAIGHARNIERPPDREFLHLLPRQFILDGQPGIFDPIGMVGTRLEVDLNIGAHSTEIVVFFEGAVVHTASIPIGGQHFTTDLAIGLGMPFAQAEQLKCEYGHAVVTSVPLAAEIEIANPEPQILRLRSLAEILEPRARELFHYVRENLREGGVLEALGAGCVLTGGGAKLPGILEVTESQLRVSARAGLPVRLSNMPGELVHPGFSTAIGMLLYAHRTRIDRDAESNTLRAKLRAIFASSF